MKKNTVNKLRYDTKIQRDKLPLIMENFVFANDDSVEPYLYNYEDTVLREILVSAEYYKYEVIPLIIEDFNKLIEMREEQLAEIKEVVDGGGEWEFYDEAFMLRSLAEFNAIKSYVFILEKIVNPPVSKLEANVAKHMNLLLTLNETYRTKNRNYGDSFSDSLDRRGLTAAIVRMEDKMNRFDTLSELTKAEEVSEKTDESLRDTLLDLANYAVMTVMWLEKKGDA